MSNRILIIDDDHDSLKMISLMLQRQGYEILAANAGNPGLKTALEELPDIILLDVMMPDMDGLEVCRQLRAQPATKEIPIIMFTAKTLVEDKLAGFEAGVTDYLTKPIHPAELAVRVKSALRTVEKQPSDEDISLELPPDIPRMSIGFVGAKGGIGTTTLTASVGTILAKSNDTILTDIRPGQGTLGLLLGMSEHAGLSNVLSLPPDQVTESVLAQNIVRYDSKMELLLSSPNPREFTFNYPVESILALKDLLSEHAHSSLFDLGPGLSRSTVPLMRELDKIVLLIEPDLFSLPIASSILTVLETRIHSDNIQIVISRRVESSHHLSLLEIEDRLQRDIVASIPPAVNDAYQAAKEEVTLAQYHPDSATVREISKLVEVLVT